jgi:hypothetical protein
MPTYPCLRCGREVAIGFRGFRVENLRHVGWQAYRVRARWSQLFSYQYTAKVPRAHGGLRSGSTRWFRTSEKRVRDGAPAHAPMPDRLALGRVGRPTPSSQANAGSISCRPADRLGLEPPLTARVLGHSQPAATAIYER